MARLASKVPTMRRNIDVPLESKLVSWKVNLLLESKLGGFRVAPELCEEIKSGN